MALVPKVGLGRKFGIGAGRRRLGVCSHECVAPNGAHVFGSAMNLRIHTLVAGAAILVVGGIELGRCVSGPRVSTAERHGLAADSSISNPPRGGGADPLPPRALGEPSRVRTAEQYAARFASEAKDATWAPAAEHLARVRLQDVLRDGSILHSVECKTSMCRIESEHKSETIHQAFLRAAFVDAPRPWNGALFIAPSEGQQAMRVLFIWREGYDPPSTTN